ncbi:hypothetical protein QUF50_04470, partial [Thiotrichales bacterium HSG1]|nr:hypothetical protein [Thiotrichales bacterium HSG1]
IWDYLVQTLNYPKTLRRHRQRNTLAVRVEGVVRFLNMIMQDLRIVRIKNHEPKNIYLVNPLILHNLVQTRSYP